MPVNESSFNEHITGCSIKNIEHSLKNCLKFFKKKFFYIIQHSVGNIYIITCFVFVVSWEYFFLSKFWFSFIFIFKIQTKKDIFWFQAKIWGRKKKLNMGNSQFSKNFTLISWNSFFYFGKYFYPKSKKIPFLPSYYFTEEIFQIFTFCPNM